MILVDKVIKLFKEETGVGLRDSQLILIEADWDFNKAYELAQLKGLGSVMQTRDKENITKDDIVFAKTKQVLARNTAYGDKIIRHEKVYRQYDKSIYDNEVWFYPANRQDYDGAICLSCKATVELIVEE